MGWWYGIRIRILHSEERLLDMDERTDFTRYGGRGEDSAEERGGGNMCIIVMRN